MKKAVRILFLIAALMLVALPTLAQDNKNVLIMARATDATGLDPHTQTAFASFRLLELIAVHRVVEEVVVDPVRLPQPRLTRRRRDGQLELGNAVEQRADQRSLADPRRPGDDEDPRHY